MTSLTDLCWKINRLLITLPSSALTRHLRGVFAIAGNDRERLNHILWKLTEEQEKCSKVRRIG